MLNQTNTLFRFNHFTCDVKTNQHVLSISFHHDELVSCFQHVDASQQVQQLVLEMDIDNSGSVDMEEFLLVMAKNIR